MDKQQQDELKKAAGIEAAKFIKDGMVAGLGTGSTVRFLVDELGRRTQEEGLQFTGVTTSRRTADQAKGYGIKIVDVDDVDHIDISIDGADEVDKNFNGIKGGGAALLWEKIVNENSNYNMWIVDASKVVDTIGQFPLPVEVIPYGSGHVLKKFEEKGYKPVLRKGTDGTEVRTDENNFIIDLHMERIERPYDLAEDLINTVGVVEHGLFLNRVDKVIVGDPNGPRILTVSED
jgi:ribose 5-phosphate isomerase A